MKEMNEHKYSRNMALSLLAGIVLGAAIVLALLWALGYFPGKGQGDALETGSDSVASEEISLAAGEEPSPDSQADVTESTTKPEPTATSEPAATPEPDVTPSPTATPEPAATAKPTATPESAATAKPTAMPESATKETTESGTDGERTPAAVSLDFQLSGSWGGDGGYYYQYIATIENTSDQKITDWEIKVPGFDGCKVDSYWCCEVEEEDGCLEVTPEDYNEEIWEGGRVEGIGLIILAEKEWELSAATLEAETARGRLTAAFGGAPAAQGGADALSGNSETGQAAGQKTQESNDGQAGRAPGQNTGAKGPDIQAGDSLGGYALTEDTPVGEHGRLRVENGSLVDQSGEPYQMHGVSTHGLAWFPEYVSEETFRTFRNEWDADVMRLAMYSDEYGGYSNGGDQKELKRLIDKGVEYASKQGMYVIIDWHVLGEGDPNIHKEDAIAIFDEVSEKYADYGNVIYEICNEPNGGVSWKDVKGYAEEVIPVIRANDPYGIILVGTPQWSQLIGDAAADPIQDYDNIMYTLHFYAATHKADLRESLEKALKDGLPVFVSECSICDASGNGGIDEKSAQAWVDLMDRYDVSYIAWAVSNKNETAALICSNCSKLSDWSDDELSDTGRWFKGQFTK